MTHVSKNNNTKTLDGLEVQLLTACAGVCAWVCVCVCVCVCVGGGGAWGVWGVVYRYESFRVRTCAHVYVSLCLCVFHCLSCDASISLLPL